MLPPQMKRIMIIGNQGSGKSTFALELAKKLQRDVIHLDNLYHVEKGVHLSHNELVKELEKIVKQEQWILDGNYTKTLDVRLQRAKMVFFLDIPRGVCLMRAIKRWWMYRHATRPELRKDIGETLSWRMIRKILFFPRKQILKKITQYKEVQVFIFKTNKQASRFTTVI